MTSKSRLICLKETLTELSSSYEEPLLDGTKYDYEVRGYYRGRTDAYRVAVKAINRILDEWICD